MRISTLSLLWVFPPHPPPSQEDGFVFYPKFWTPFLEEACILWAGSKFSNTKEKIHNFFSIDRRKLHLLRYRRKTTRNEMNALHRQSYRIWGLIYSLPLGLGWGITLDHLTLWRLEALPRVERIRRALRTKLKSAESLWLWKSISDYTKSWLPFGASKRKQKKEILA